jgi:archaellum component FlaC
MSGRGITVDFNANVARFTSAIDKATNDLSKFQTNTERIGKNINTALSGIGAGLSAGAVVAFGKSVIDGLDKLNDLSKTTGLAVNQLAGLGVAAKQSGADLDGAANAISKLSVNIGKDGDKFRALGITAKEPLEAFKQLADVFVAIKDPQERAAVAAAALGKSWQDAAPLLSEGGAAIGRMVSEGEKASGVTKEMAEQADKFNDELEKLKASIGGVAIGLTGSLVPALNDAIKNMKNLFAPEEDMKITTRLNYLRDSMDSIISRRQMIGKLGFDSSGLWEADLQKLNNEALSLQQTLAKLQSTGPAKIALPNIPSKSSISAFLGSDTSSKRTNDWAKKAADDRLKIAQHEMDVELEAFNRFHKDREKAAKDSQQALNDLMKSGQDLKLSVDPMARMNAEVAKFSELLKAGAIEQKTFDLAVAKSAADMERATKVSFDGLKSNADASSERLNAVLIGFQTNVQRNMGDTVFKTLSGDFDSIGNAWKTMLLRMASDAIAADLANTIFGAGGKKGGFLKMGLSILGDVMGLFGGGGKGIGSALKMTSGGLTGFAANGAYFDGKGMANFSKFANGGIVNSPTMFKFESGGALQNGLMGEAGPEAIMPLKRDSKGRLGVSGGGGGGVVINDNRTINIDSRSDRASIHQDVQKLIQRGNAELVDKLERNGRI